MIVKTSSKLDFSISEISQISAPDIPNQMYINWLLPQTKKLANITETTSNIPTGKTNDFNCDKKYHEDHVNLN